MQRVRGRNLLVGVVVCLAVSLTFGGVPLAAAPPPPRFVTDANNIHVLALLDNARGRGRLQLSEIQGAALGDATLISKTVDATSVAADGTLHYSIAITNSTTITQSFRITDTLPAGLSYKANSASPGLFYNAASNSLTATTSSLNAFGGELTPTTGVVSYTEILTDTRSHNICLTYFTDCDDNAIILGGVPFRYMGVDYTSITLDSNGFVMPGTPLPNELDTDAENQLLPNTAAPNGVIAPFWDELDLMGQNGDTKGGGDWLWAVLPGTNPTADYLVVEWHNAQKENVPGTAYSFQILIRLYDEYITFAYADPAFTVDTSSATVGFENSAGTLGDYYLYNGTGQVPVAGSALLLDADFSTAEFGFDALAQHNLRGCSSITNTAMLSNGSGTLQSSAAAAVSTFGPCLFLPWITR